MEGLLWRREDFSEALQMISHDEVLCSLSKLLMEKQANMGPQHTSPVHANMTDSTIRCSAHSERRKQEGFAQ